MRRVRLLLVLAVAAAMVPGFARAQESDSEPEPALRAGAWALQFQISNDFRLGSFQGTVLSIKRHFSDRSALRLGLGLSFSTDDMDQTISMGDTLTTLSERSDSRQNVRVDFQYVRYPNPTRPVKFLLGVGPLVSFTNSDSERTVGSAREKVETTSWAAGVSGLLGVEWFAASRISLHAEYGMEIFYQHSEQKSTIPGRVLESTSKGGDIRARGVLFGLSAYF